MPIQGDQRQKKTIYQGGGDKDTARANQRWWLLEEDRIFDGVFSVCDDILQNSSARRRMNWFFSCLYNDTGISGMAGAKFNNLYYNRTSTDGAAGQHSTMSVNVMQNVIDTATAMIAKNKPKPQFLTDGTGDYATKVKGKKLTKYVEGVFDETKLYSKSQRVFTDACIYGTGFLKLFEEEGKLCVEPLFVEEVLVDDLDGMHGSPCQLNQRKFRARDELIALFPKKREQIMGSAQVAGGTATFSTADLIPVIESWHMKSGPKAKDGLHTICIDNCTLLCEPYDKDYFPIFAFRWANQTLGYWGRGICHEIWKMQRELDSIYQTIQMMMRLGAGAIIAVETGSAIAEDHLTSNKRFKVLEFNQTAPQYLLPPLVQPELYEHAQTLTDQMYKILE